MRISRLTAVVLVCILGYYPQVQEPPKFVLGDKHVFLVEKPILVSGPTVTQPSWSPNSKYIIMVRSAAEGTAMVMYWTRGEAQAKSLMTIETVNGIVAQHTTINWFPGTSVCLLSTFGPYSESADAPPTNLTWVDVAHRETRSLSLLPGARYITISPKLPAAVVVGTAFGPKGEVPTTTLYSISAKGVIGRRVALSANALAEGWDDKGRLIIYQESGSNITTTQLFDPVTSTLIPMGKPPSDETALEPARQELVLVLDEFDIRRDKRHQIAHPLWLLGDAKGDSPAALISADVQGEYALSPDLHALFFTEHGALWVIPLTAVSKEQYLAAKRASERTRLLSNGKQIGLAAMMYASDWDDALPPSSDFANLVMPYIKNGDVLAGFVFLLNGENLDKFEQPAATKLGYIPGPGGQVIVWLDGHVTWEAEKPK